MIIVTKWADDFKVGIYTKYAPILTTYAGFIVCDFSVWYIQIIKGKPKYKGQAKTDSGGKNHDTEY